MDWRPLLASPLGFLIGLSLGALGGGGSILAVPALVYGAGQTPQQATTTSLLIVGGVALVGLVPHARAGNVRLADGLLFGAVGIAGNFAGSKLNAFVDANVLLLAFSVVMVLAALAMWHRSRRVVPDAEAPADESLLEELEDAAAAAGPPLGDPTAIGPLTTAERTGRRVHLGVATVAKVVLTGTAVGFLTGFFGVGGGFVIVPALVFALGLPMKKAVGTSLLVIAINSAVALASRWGSGSFDPTVAVEFGIAGALGVVVGSRMAKTVDAARLTAAFAILLVAVAVYTAARSLVALT